MEGGLPFYLLLLLAVAAGWLLLASFIWYFSRDMVASMPARHR
jgi:hypothetical protein